MQTEERNRLVKAYYDPELNSIACVAKCTAGLAIIILIAVIGVISTDDGHEKLADDGHLETTQLQAVGAPRQQERGLHESQRVRVEAKNDLKRSQGAAY